MSQDNGTPSKCTNTQFDKTLARITKALPRAMKLSGLDIKSILRHTDEGERLSLALAEAFRMLYNGHVATMIPIILRRLYADEVITAAGRNMSVYELAKNADFPTMYDSLGTDLENLWMTKAQRAAFCEEHPDKLRKDGFATFFLHKEDETKPATPDNLVVAYVDVYSDGLYVRVYRFENVSVWDAEFQHRLVSPQL